MICPLKTRPSSLFLSTTACRPPTRVHRLSEQNRIEAKRRLGRFASMKNESKIANPSAMPAEAMDGGKCKRKRSERDELFDHTFAIHFRLPADLESRQRSDHDKTTPCCFRLHAAHRSVGLCPVTTYRVLPTNNLVVVVGSQTQGLYRRRGRDDGPPSARSLERARRSGNHFGARRTSQGRCDAQKAHQRGRRCHSV